MTNSERRQKFVDWLNHAVDELAERHGWSLNEIAIRGQISVPQLRRWRQGLFDKAPRERTLVRFCEGLGLDPQEPTVIFGYRSDVYVDLLRDDAAELNPFEGYSISELQDATVKFRYILKDPTLSGERRAEIRAMLQEATTQYMRSLKTAHPEIEASPKRDSA
ncbi:helix-turn-helix domain-containing protein [Salininema proteolyticum]|uniref:Helix-turn-helix domain-containing protein n=1 Tax=Salininema proteolyticum TaxID=1607685 RepID=A0ABV8TU40_9ACTN